LEHAGKETDITGAVLNAPYPRTIAAPATGAPACVVNVFVIVLPL
jgi:hypothetical protein